MNAKKMILMTLLTVILLKKGFPLIYVAPSCYLFDLAVVPAAACGIAYGAESGLLMLFIKEVLGLFFGRNGLPIPAHIASWMVGNLLDIIFMYGVLFFQDDEMFSDRRMRGLFFGIVGQGIAGMLCSFVFLARIYAWSYGMDLGEFVDGATQIDASIHSLPSFCLRAILPFYLIKGVITYLDARFVCWLMCLLKREKRSAGEKKNRFLFSLREKN